MGQSDMLEKWRRMGSNDGVPDPDAISEPVMRWGAVNTAFKDGGFGALFAGKRRAEHSFSAAANSATNRMLIISGIWTSKEVGDQSALLYSRAHQWILQFVGIQISPHQGRTPSETHEKSGSGVSWR